MVTVAEDRTRERTVEGAPMEAPVAKSLNGARVAILKSDVPYACSFLYGYIRTIAVRVQLRPAAWRHAARRRADRGAMVS